MTEMHSPPCPPLSELQKLSAVLHANAGSSTAALSRLEIDLARVISNQDILLKGSTKVEYLDEESKRCREASMHQWKVIREQGSALTRGIAELREAFVRIESAVQSNKERNNVADKRFWQVLMFIATFSAALGALWTAFRG